MIAPNYSHQLNSCPYIYYLFPSCSLFDLVAVYFEQYIVTSLSFFPDLSIYLPVDNFQISYLFHYIYIFFYLKDFYLRDVARYSFLQKYYLERLLSANVEQCLSYCQFCSPFRFLSGDYNVKCEREL